MEKEQHLFNASVPVFLHYLDQARGLVGHMERQPELCAARLAPDMLTCAEQIATAAGFTLRTAYPLADQPGRLHDR